MPHLSVSFLPRGRESSSIEPDQRSPRAIQTGIYDFPIQNDTIYEEQDEEKEEEEEGFYESQNEETGQNDAQNQEIENAQVAGKKKRGERGPTKLRRFWHEYEPNKKINLVFNHLGQPCGTKTCRLSNFIGNLVKGKEISLAATNWNKVPKSEKDKLWNTVLAFFNIDESHKSWVLKSASKKWKDFKSVIKSKYFDSEKSINQNIANGCNGRIPPIQWAWLVKYWKTNKAQVISEKNKGARTSQCNAVHTSGSRGFAVVHDQEEIRQGRRVGRAELYCITHTDKDGNPVDDFCAAKISKIKDKLDSDPSLLGEEANEEDLYSTVFPKGVKSTRHGLGLVVGGRGYEKIDQVISALWQSQDENRDLRRMVGALMENQRFLKEQNEMVKQQNEMVVNKCNQMMVLFEASQKQNSSSMQPKDVEEVQGREVSKQQSTSQNDAVGTPCFQAQVDPPKKKHKERKVPSLEQDKVDKMEHSNVENLKTASLELEVDKTSKKHKERMVKKPEIKNSEAPKPKQDEVDKMEASNVENRKAASNKTNEVPNIVKVKLEKAEANKAKWLKDVSNRNIDVIKRGMEVSLRSPNSLILAAMGTVQNTDENAVGSDGKPLSDYVEVLVNYVMRNETRLPRAYGRIKTLKGATAKCIPWPRININLITEPDLGHRKMVEDKRKRKRCNNDATMTDGATASSSQAAYSSVISGSQRGNEVCSI